MYASYLNLFLKIKQESSGYPEDVLTDENKERYSEEYRRKEGILQEPDKIEYNEGRRTLAKICLNCTWGFWARKFHRKKKLLTHDPNSFYDFCTDPTNENVNFRFINDETVFVQGESIDSVERADCKGSFIHAIFTTAQARLRLFKMLLQPFGNRIFYMDSDSAIVKCNLNKPCEDPPCWSLFRRLDKCFELLRRCYTEILCRRS